MNKSKLKQIIKEEYVDIMLDKKLREAEEGDTPKHFGSGQNIDVYGYTTQHFDICGSAVALFTKINEKGLEGMAKKYAHLSAKYLDEFFGIEKDVVEEGSAAPEQMEEAADKLALFAYELGCVGAYAKEDYTRDMAFSKMHLMVIADRYDGKMTEAKLEKEKFTEPDEMRMDEAPMDKNFQKDWEKSGKALRNHLAHELKVGKGVIGSTNLRTLMNLDQIVKLAIDVPKKMSQIVGEGKIDESTKAYGDALKALERERTLKALSTKDKDTLLKLASLMKKHGMTKEGIKALKEKLVFYTDDKGRIRRFDDGN